jgi:hypothetical protein
MEESSRAEVFPASAPPSSYDSRLKAVEPPTSPRRRRTRIGQNDLLLAAPGRVARDVAPSGGGLCRAAAAECRGGWELREHAQRSSGAEAKLGAEGGEQWGIGSGETELDYAGRLSATGRLGFQ